MENDVKDKTKELVKQTFNPLKFAVVMILIVAGIDKFTNLLTHWEHYLNPVFLKILPFSASTFMMMVGGLEIIAGIIVWKKPEIGGYLAAGWLTAIALTLLVGFNFMDLAVRDLVLAISAFVLARISKITK